MRTPKKWNLDAQRRIRKLLELTQNISPFMERGPQDNEWELGLAFLSEAEMTDVYFKHKGEKRATDVLSFPSVDFHFNQGLLGEILICMPVLKQQAKERGITDEMEMMILVTHGFLHLLGFDHEKSKKEAKFMAELESALLSAIVPKSWVKDSKGKCLEGLIERVHSCN